MTAAKDVALARGREKGLDLVDEFTAATAAVERRHFDALAALGVSRRFLFLGPMRFGVAAITTSDRFYEPREDGTPAVIMPAIPLAAPWEDGFGEDDVGDLIAFSARAPQQWWCRCGLVPVLNPDAILRAESFRTPLQVRTSPLSWLRHSGDGCVLLDRAADVRLLFGGVPRIVADDLYSGEAMDRAWRRRDRRPEIHIAVEA